MNFKDHLKASQELIDLANSQVADGNYRSAQFSLAAAYVHNHLLIEKIEHSLVAKAKTKTSLEENSGGP